MSCLMGRSGLLAMALIAFHAMPPAHAQSYPSKTINIVVTLAPGTGMDSLVRLYGQALSDRLGKPVVVENRTGASQMLGTTAVANAPADGHTLLVATSSAMAINPALYKQIQYSPERDFIPIAIYVKGPFILITNPALPIHSVPDFIKYAKEAKAPLTYSSVGIGSPQHLSMEFMKHRFGLPMTHVPYRNQGQALTDTVGGQVDVGFTEAPAGLPVVSSGKIRALAVSSKTALPLLPQTPPLAEAADAPDFEAVSWHGLFAPAQTPKDIVEKLQAEIKDILSKPDMQKRAADLGLIPIEIQSTDGMRAFIKSEQEKWGALVRDLKLGGTQ